MRLGPPTGVGDPTGWEFVYRCRHGEKVAHSDRHHYIEMRCPVGGGTCKFHIDHRRDAPGDDLTEIMELL